MKLLQGCLHTCRCCILTHIIITESQESEIIPYPADNCSLYALKIYDWLTTANTPYALCYNYKINES